MTALMDRPAGRHLPFTWDADPATTEYQRHEVARRKAAADGFVVLGIERSEWNEDGTFTAWVWVTR